ncbi:MAG: putative sugar nucleotidyl transferase, partial [Melioribacteraceae bacterium]
MKKAVCLFEDEGFQNFLPLVYTRPAYDLRCGILTIREKIKTRFSSYNLILHTRSYLKEFVQEENPKILVNQFDLPNILFINGRLIVAKDSVDQIKKLKDNSILYTDDGSVVAANLSGENLDKLIKSENEFFPFQLLKNIQHVESNLELIKYPWHLVNTNGAEIVNDFNLIVKKVQKNDAGKFKSVEFKNKKKIFISKNAVIDPFVFVDASDGPVYIGKNARIMSQTYIQGPAYIGDNSIIKSG